MTETSTLQLPDWYDPSATATVDPGGYWTPPLAAGLDARGDTISLVVLHHQSFEPAYIRELSSDKGLDQVHGCLAEAARTLTNYNVLLCCAVIGDQDSKEARALRSTGPWLWVRYPHSVIYDAYNRSRHLDRAWDKDHYYALALAMQLQEDFETLQAFDREYRHLLTLTQAMRRLKQILMTKFPDDLARVARLRHDLSF